MAKKTELIVEIDPSGKVHVEVKGAPGKKCLEWLKLVEAALGKVESQRATPEMYEAEVTSDARQQVTNRRKP